MSVIRNTNTKIIMRLPDLEDRNLVGKSANLSEDQIKELAKIPTGVAAVYQNNWLEPVLCKIPYEKTEGRYINQNDNPSVANREDVVVVNKLLDRVAGERLDLNMNELVQKVIKSSFSTKVKADIISLFKQNGKIGLENISSVIYDIASSPELEKEADRADSIENWKNTFVYSEDSIISYLTEEKQNLIVECILREQIARHDKPDEYLQTWYKYISGEVV